MEPPVASTVTPLTPIPTATASTQTPCLKFILIKAVLSSFVFRRVAGWFGIDICFRIN
jgi:hypothetical protein